MLLRLTHTTTVDIDKMMVLGIDVQLKARMEGYRGLLTIQDKASVVEIATRLLGAPGRQDLVFVFYNNVLLRKGSILCAQPVENHATYDTNLGPGILVTLSGAPYDDAVTLSGGAMLLDEHIFFPTKPRAAGQSPDIFGESPLDEQWRRFQQAISDNLEASLQMACSS